MNSRKKKNSDSKAEMEKLIGSKEAPKRQKDRSKAKIDKRGEES